MKNKSGITLIALIITIIVMLILVAVSVRILIKSDLIGIAEKSGEAYKTAHEEEQNLSKVTVNGKEYASIEDYIDGKEIEYIPEGGKYIAADGTVYEAGDEFPTIATGDIYNYGDYEYKYNAYWDGRAWTENSEQKGWGVRATDIGKSKYGELLSTINGENLTSMRNAFHSSRISTCSIRVAPKIPNTVKDLTGTFRGCWYIETVDIPEGVIIMNDTFAGSGIKEVSIPSTVQEIESAFADSDLISVDLSKATKLTSLEYTFYRCSSLTTMPTIPESVINMDYSFWKCSNLVETTPIPENVTSMFYAFKECSSLEIAPDMSKATKITELIATFEDCTSLKTINSLPPNLSRTSATFMDCTSIVNTPLLPEKVKDLYNAFAGCTSLTTVTNLPNSLTELKQTFSGCTSLTTVPEIPSNVTNIERAFNNCTSLVKAPKIPSKVSYMSYAFRNCTSLAGEIEINATPSGYSECFLNCNMDNITITGDCKIKDALIATATAAENL